MVLYCCELRLICRLCAATRPPAPRQIDAAAKSGERKSIAKGVITEVRFIAAVPPRPRALPLPLAALIRSKANPLTIKPGILSFLSSQVLQLVKTGEEPTNPMLADVAKEIEARLKKEKALAKSDGRREVEMETGGTRITLLVQAKKAEARLLASAHAGLPLNA